MFLVATAAAPAADAACSATPNVSLSFVAPNADGQGTLVINYGFPDTTSQDQRLVGYGMTQPNGSHGEIIGGSFHPDDVSGSAMILVIVPGG